MWKRAFSTHVPRPKRVILSGIQPTGIPHLGNYLGALDNWVRLQDKDTTTYYMVVDLHAITMPQDAKILRQSKRDMATALLACGVSPEQSAIFEQSKVRGHAELAWIFNCITPVGWLGRMTQWKSKLGKAHGSHADALLDTSTSTASLKMGLFDYPVLQAADILLYKASHVPVGADQIQHLELTRDIASLFNSHFKHKFFEKPDAISPPATKRVMSLRDPTSKMSKSDVSEMSRISLFDTPDAIRKKIGRAVTDSEPGVTFDQEHRPGVANLINIYSAMTNKTTEESMQDFGQLTSMQPFKQMVADAVITRLEPIQKEYARLQADPAFVQKVLDDGAAKAQVVADKTIKEVYNIVGF
ncbi:tryptophanyl-tRNA synthetase [Hesseltinella vesiculosa]|uniref:Tryptophan--tRNA ligase, mitochondrial n=1 Tax=Hesseltinella vesiculosa TaxID=101127 RepID=A0A1X2GUP3_9FUNG|nr:tryptophanyl-tRNA synthetase [Hesseltinella vesiculosa]